MPPAQAETSAAWTQVLDPQFLRKLARLHLTVRLSLATRPGNTPMPTGSQGSGLELSRHKAYAPGDDLRHVDWNAYGRLDEMVVKTYRAEREAPLHLLIDTSASMGTPPGDGKFRFAQALAVSLAYVSMRQQDRVRIVALGEGVPGALASPFFAHPLRLHEIGVFLSTLQPHGSITIDRAIADYLHSTRSPGIAIVLSDFLVPAPAYQDALNQLLARGYAVAALRLIGEQERDPRSLPDRVRLRDAESGRERSLVLSPANRLAYQAAVHRHLAQLKAWCETRAVVFATVDTSAGLQSCLLHDLPRAGLLR